MPDDREKAIYWTMGLSFFSFKEVERMIKIENLASLIKRDFQYYPEKTGAGIFTRYLIEGRVANWLVTDKTTPWRFTPFAANQFLPVTVRMNLNVKIILGCVGKSLNIYIHHFLKYLIII